MELRAANRFRPREEPQRKIHAKANLLSIPEIPLMSADKILNAVCLVLCIDKDFVKSKSHKKEGSQARIITVGLALRANPKITLVSLGAFFSRHHSSIFYARDIFNDLYMYNKQFKEKADKVINTLLNL